MNTSKYVLCEPIPIEEFLYKCMTIMHDKMNHANIESFMFSYKTKHLYELIKLFVFMIGMLSHRYGKVKYFHYDVNYIVGLIAKLL